MKSPYYFLQRTKTPPQNYRSRFIALIILVAAVLFAVLMHLPHPKPQPVHFAQKPKPVAQVVVPTMQTYTVEQQMPYGTHTIYSASLPAGTSKITTPGVPGIWTKTYQTTTINGKESPKRLVNITTTRDAVTEVITQGTGPAH